jgi:hypothetical protein
MAFWNSEILGAGVTQMVIPTGITSAQFGPLPGQVEVIFGALSGGSLAVVNAASGMTSAQGFFVASNSLLRLPTSGPVYLIAGGATATISLLYLQSAALPPDNN